MLDLIRKKRDNINSSAVEISSEMTSQLKGIFDNIREEFDEHLTSINENTNEIQANFEYMCNIDAKLEKMGERIDQMQLFLQKSLGFKVDKKQVFNVKPLTKKEKDVFLIIYTLDELKKQCTIKDISKRSGYSETLISNYITNMVEKGVPILKKYINSRSCYTLNKVFKKLQAKENILKIEQQTLLKSFK